MKKVLITGAGGYIGSVTTYYFLQNGYKVVALDNFSTGFKQPLELLQEKFGKDSLKIVEADLTEDLSLVSQDFKEVDTVIHFASKLSVNESMEKPLDYFKNNVCGSENLLSEALKNGVKNFVFSSTCAVYGEVEKSPIDEETFLNPTNPYGESKKIVETILKWLHGLKDLNYISLRYFNVCGASDDGLIGDSKKPSVHLVQNAIKGALNLEKFYLTYSEVDTPDKSPIRDYVNVVDLAKAHFKACEYLLNKGGSEVINIGTGTGSSVLEIVELVEKITGVGLEKSRGNQRRGEYSSSVASIKRAKEILNWYPEKNLSDSVNSLIKWYKARPRGWDY